MRTHGGNSPINRTYTKSRDWRLEFRTQSGCGIHHYFPRSHGGTQTRSTVLKGFPSMAHQRAPAKPWPDQPPEWEMRMSGCRWTPIRLRVRALAVVRWRTVLESQPVFRGLFLALAVAAFVASCGNDAGDAVGKKNHEWLTRRWKHLKILRPPMLLGTSFGWAIAAMYAFLAFKSTQAGITSHVWGWSIAIILAALVVPTIMFELMRRGE